MSEIIKTSCDFTFRGWPPELWQEARQATFDIQRKMKSLREHSSTGVELVMECQRAPNAVGSTRLAPSGFDLEKHSGYLESP